VALRELCVAFCRERSSRGRSGRGRRGRRGRGRQGHRGRGHRGHRGGRGRGEITSARDRYVS